MEEFKGTKGKWRVDISTPSLEKKYHIKSTDGRGRFVAEVLRFDPYPIDEEEIKANAQLMAAAPELLETLQNLSKWVENLQDWPGGNEIDSPVKEAKAAINKALGK